jgi:hypothetical protein
LSAWPAEKKGAAPHPPPVLQKRGQKVLKTKESALKRAIKDDKEIRKTMITIEIS